MVNWNNVATGHLNFARVNLDPGWKEIAPDLAYAGTSALDSLFGSSPVNLKAKAWAALATKWRGQTQDSLNRGIPAMSEENVTALGEEIDKQTARLVQLTDAGLKYVSPISAGAKGFVEGIGEGVFDVKDFFGRYKWAFVAIGVIWAIGQVRR